MRSRLRWRLSVPYVALAAVTLAALALYLLAYVRQVYFDALQQSLVSEARLIAEVVRPDLVSGETQDLDAVADRYAALLGSRVTIMDREGRVWGDSAEDPARMLGHLFRPEVQQALNLGEGEAIRYSDTLQDELMYGAVRVEEGVASGGAVVGFVRVAVPLSATHAKVARFRNAVLSSVAIILLVTWLIQVLLAERIVRPVRRLTEAAERVEAGDLSAYLMPTTSDEIGQLMHRFNAMAQRLRASMDSLESERAQLAAVLDNMADGVMIVDADGRVQLVNPAALRLLRLARAEEALGRSLVQVVHEHQIAAVWQAAARDGRERVELVEAGRQGLLLQVIASPLGEADSGQFVVMLQDLSQVRRLETVRREFVSNISHELRTPLASLKALTETLSDGALDDPPAAQRFLARMEGEIDALTQMVQELLELSRIESGQVPVRLEPVAVRDFVSPAVERLRPQAERAALELIVALPEDLPFVLGDAERLAQVVTNLVHNAIKFTPAGGRVRVTAHAEGDEVFIEVEDTGVGIAPDLLPRIFERFFKADRSRSSGGTGLGLAIAKHIVQAHGGRIWAASQEGKGSRFSFSLLRAEAAQQCPVS